MTGLIHGRAGIFFFTTIFRLAVGPTQSLIQWVTGAFFLGVKWLGHYGDDSSPSVAEIKNKWRYTSTSIGLRGVVLN
jgi:hypothetical protein